MKGNRQRHPSNPNSPLRYPGGRDRGQRFEVRYHDGMGTVRTFGFTDDAMQAHRMMRNIRRNPRWSNVEIIDRHARQLEAAGG